MSIRNLDATTGGIWFHLRASERTARIAVPWFVRFRPGYLGAQTSPQMLAASGIGEDTGFGAVLGYNLSPSAFASANERINIIHVTSRPNRDRELDEAAAVYSLAPAFASAVADHQHTPQPCH